MFYCSIGVCKKKETKYCYKMYNPLPLPASSKLPRIRDITNSMLLSHKFGMLSLFFSCLLLGMSGGVNGADLLDFSLLAVLRSQKPMSAFDSSLN